MGIDVSKLFGKLKNPALPLWTNGLPEEDLRGIIAPSNRSPLTQLGAGLWRGFKNWGEAGTPGGTDGLIGAVGDNLPISIMPQDALKMTLPQENLQRPEIPDVGLSNIAASQTPLEMTQDRINEIQSKDYSRAKYDNDGNLIKAAGTDRDQDWTWKDKVLSALVGAGEGLMSGGLFGAAAGGISAGTDRNFMEKRKDNFDLAKLFPRVQQQQQQEKFQSDMANAATNRQNIKDDNNRAETEFAERMKYNRDEQTRKVSDRKSREETARMNAISGMFKNIPSFDPDDPKQAELKEALKSVGLPLTKKDAKKNVKLIQDQRSGAWSVVLTDPISGGQETRDVKSADGKGILTTTPQVVMAGELGLLKQDDQQKFTADENEKNRQQQIVLRQLSADLDRQMADYRSKLEAAQKETDFNRRKQLQDQAEASRIEGIRLTQRLEQENLLLKK